MFKTFEYSGRVGSAPVWLLLLGVPLLFVLALLYSYLVVYIPIAGVVTVFLVFGFAFGTGAILGRVMMLGKCRNAKAAALMGLAGGALALYFAWVFFILALFNREGNEGIALSECLNPAVLWRAILVVNDSGWYTVKGSTPSGIVLWIGWAIEAVVVVGGGWLMATTAIENELFCETCGKWCKVKETKFAPVEGALLTTPIKDVAFTDVVMLPTQDALAKPCFRSELLTCPACDFKGIRFARLTEQVDKEGKASTTTETVPGVVVV